MILIIVSKDVLYLPLRMIDVYLCLPLRHFLDIFYVMKAEVAELVDALDSKSSPAYPG